MFNNTAVTHVTVILDKPSDWFNWLFIRKNSCRRHDLWKYVNPDIPIDQIPQMEQPREPLIIDYTATATTFAMLKEEDRNSFRWDYERYERKLLEFTKKVQALAEFNLEISKNISQRRIYIFQNCETAHERLIALKKHLAPDVATRQHEIIEKYNNLKVAPSSMKKVEHWLSEWTQVTSMGKQMNLPETDGTRLQEDFLVSCKALDTEYATTCLRDVYKAENSGTTDLLPTLDDYVVEFTAFLRRNKPIPWSLYIAAAELKLVKPVDEKSDNSKGKRRNCKPIPKCLCGENHWYSDCFVINKEHPDRPSSFRSSDTVNELVRAARRDPKVETRVRNSLERWRKHQEKRIKTLSIDDGLPPTTNETFTISISGRMRDEEALEQSQDHNFNKFECITMDGGEQTAHQPSALALERDPDDKLLNRWIFDPGSNTHVINTELWKGWKFERNNTEGRTISAGKTKTQITTWGGVDIVAKSPEGFQNLRLTHVALVEGFLTSLIGLARCRKEGIHFDSGRDILYKGQPNKVIANLEYTGGHWLIDADPTRRPLLPHLQKPILSNFGVSNRPSYAPKPPSRLSRRTAHEIWAHPGKKTIDHLENHVNGVTIIGGDIEECLCEACLQAKLKKIFSRRPGEDKSKKPLYRIGIDIVYIVPMSDQCWNGDKYMLHAVDEYTKWHEVSTVRNKSKSVLMRLIKSVIRKIQRLFNFDISVIRSDNERGFGNELITLCDELGIKFEAAVKGTPEQNGLAERAGGILTTKARVMRIHANLPKNLDNEMYNTAAYILNRTPIESLGWRTPYELIWNRKPLVSHMHPIGCQAYSLNQDIRKGDKTESRALIGHLVGYQSTNIFRIWLPSADEIIVTRDVIFNPSLFFNENNEYAKESSIKQTIEILEYPEWRDDDIEIDKLLTLRQGWHTEPKLKSEVSTPILQLSDVPFDTSIEPTKDFVSQPLKVVEEYRAHGEPAPQEINPNPMDTSLIIQGKRTRKQAQNPNVFIINAHTNLLKTDLVSTYIKTFATEITKPLTTNNIQRIHQSQLPLPPRTVRTLKSHKFESFFLEAMEREWNSLCEKVCFKETDKTKFTVDAELLPLMWVFSYKTCEDGFLTSFKARLVVRGDLEESLDDTYAATLAIRNFRAIIAISNYFDLDLRQYDVPIAFLNAQINRKLYAEILDSIQGIKGEIFEVQRALYVLKESPLLWYEELKNSLIKLGLQPLEGFQCLYTNAWLILFVYVDDIVMAFHRSNMSLHINFERSIQDLYNVKSMGNIAWFLGIRVIRDRISKKTWLVQDAFIAKVRDRFGIESTGKFPEVPLTDNWLPQSNEEPDNVRIKLYQQLVGSLAYIAVWGRPDVARTHVVFACHLTNPGQSHISKIKQTWRYLLGTKSYALEASGSLSGPIEYINDDQTYKNPLFFGSSDASYADEPETRRSSQGYLFKFGGMVIDWKSMVQRTVTKSTTESELLTLSMAGSQMQEWIRFFDRISLKLDCKPTIWCDNQQTVGIVTKSQDKLQTKVKHVDIHQLWIRQEVEQSRINVEWVSTENMPADGLTKILQRQKFVKFVKQLGLTDITTRIRENKLLLAN